MATALDILNRSMRLLGALGSGEVAEAEEQVDGLVALNAMLESWRTESLMVYAFSESPLTMTGAASHTVGTGGNLNIERPVDIENFYFTLNGIDYPVRRIDEKEYNAISDKTVTGDIVECVWYNPTYPLGTLSVYPKVSGGTLKVVTWNVLTSFATISTAVALPPGYERALAYNLALEISPEYQINPPQMTMQIARESKANIKRANQSTRLMVNQTAINTCSPCNIYTD